MWNNYLIPGSLHEALQLLDERAGSARVIAGGTDIMVEVARGQSSPETLIDITHIPQLDSISVDDNERIHLGPLVTHNDVVGSALCVARAFPLVRACFEVGAPQIRNRGTVAGNIATASPANDSIPPLLALDADVTLAKHDGGRTVALSQLIEGPGQTIIEPNEIIVDVSFAGLGDVQRGTFIKLGLRGAQAISVVNIAAVLTFDDDVVIAARLALGSVASTVVRAPGAESMLVGSKLTVDSIQLAAENVATSISPISDIRGSAEYRRYMARILTRDALEQLRNSLERETMPASPVLLRSRRSGAISLHPRDVSSQAAFAASGPEPITTSINGHERTISGANDKTLSQMLRDVAGLSGTKEACGEGECGACTVQIDGTAVMSCIVPAPQAHGREITTVEGLESPDGSLHRVQEAFIDKGAVQCGFCTAGLLVSGAALFDERRAPDTDEIKQAICGNLCRCTAYYPIMAAFEAVATEQQVSL